MGKLKGIVQFTGSFDGLSFYEMNGKIVVRKTGGFDGEKIKNNANYARVRENSAEFAHCAIVGKYFRNAIASCLLPLRIPFVHNRVVGLFQRVLKWDTVTVRGQRTVSKGLLTPEGKKVVLDFEFDKNRTFSSYFPFKMETDFTSGVFTVFDFCASVLTVPNGANQVQLQLHVVLLDFEHLTSAVTQTSTVVLDNLKDSTTTPLNLFFSTTFADSFVPLALLEVCFLQEVNGNFVKLKGGGLKIVGVK
jgi:hypothetical protein